MYQYPQEPKKIRERINRYERKLRKEYEKFGSISDGYGKRYLLGPLYLVLGDLTHRFPYNLPGGPELASIL